MSCDAVLVPTTTILRSRESLALHYLSIIDKNSFEEIKTNAKLSGSNEYIDYLRGISSTFDFNGSYDNFEQARSSYFQKIQFDRNYDKSIDLIQNGLPTHVTDAWIRCKAIHADNSPGGYLIRCSYYNDTRAIIVSEYIRRPGQGLPNQITVIDSKIIGGTREKRPELFRPKTIITPGIQRYVIDRNPKSSIQIIVNYAIGPDSNAAELFVDLPTIVVKPRTQFQVTVESSADNSTIEITNDSGHFEAITNGIRRTEITPYTIFTRPSINLKRSVPGQGTVVFHCLLITKQSNVVSMIANTNPQGTVLMRVHDLDGNLLAIFPLNNVDRSLGIDTTP